MVFFPEGGVPTFYVSILRTPQMIWVWRATVEWYWQGKPEELGEKPVPVPLCPPQIPHGLTRERTRASAVRGRRLTTWAMHGLQWDYSLIPATTRDNDTCYYFKFRYFSQKILYPVLNIQPCPCVFGDSNVKEDRKTSFHFIFRSTIHHLWDTKGRRNVQTVSPGI
jgi:hypothetical protein